ncbi:MAG: hypothetical protein ACTTJ6_06950 [Treponema sp.]
MSLSIDKNVILLQKKLQKSIEDIENTLPYKMLCIKEALINSKSN